MICGFIAHVPFVPFAGDHFKAVCRPFGFGLFNGFFVFVGVDTISKLFSGIVPIFSGFF